MKDRACGCGAKLSELRAENPEPRGLHCGELPGACGGAAKQRNGAHAPDADGSRDNDAASAPGAAPAASDGATTRRAEPMRLDAAVQVDGPAQAVAAAVPLPVPARLREAPLAAFRTAVLGIPRRVSRYMHISLRATYTQVLVRALAGIETGDPALVAWGLLVPALAHSAGNSTATLALLADLSTEGGMETRFAKLLADGEHAHARAAEARGNTADPDKARRARALRLFEAGEAIRGWQALTGLPPASGDDVAAKLRELLGSDPLDTADTASAQMPIVPDHPVADIDPPTAADVTQMLRRLPKLSGAGPDRCYGEHLQRAAFGEPRVATVLARVIGMLLRGELAHEAREIFRVASVTALRKPSGGVRPISIPVLIYRLASSWSARTVARKLGAWLRTSGGAVAVGTRGAIEEVVHTLRRARQEGRVIAKLDRVNAFGTLDRTATRRAVSIVAPGMLHLFDLMYGGPIAAFSPTGTIEVRRGFLQGDPSVPGYYTIASLGPAQQLMRELGDDLNALRGFLDDTALAAKDAATVEHLKIRLAELEAPLGLRMDDAKCESSVPAAGFHVAPERDGLRILGATVGTDAAVERAALAGATRIVAALDELRCADDVPRHVALYVTKYSLAAPAASHLLRTTPPPQARCAAEQIDTAVARMLASLAGTAAEAPPLRGIADWPTSQGGLGLTPCAVASGPAYLGGLAAAEHAFKAGRRAEPQAGGCICGVAGHTACTRRNRLCRVCCALRSACGGCAIPGPAELWDKHPVAAGLVRDAVRTALAETGADAPYDNWITHAVTAAYCRADTQRALTRAVLALRRQVALRAAPQ